MNKTEINAEIVAHSLSPQGDELISVLCTFPRIILAEVNTHRMLSKNTSSSRAIPFKKMVEAVQNNPFIPIAWQKEHKGMQGYEYIIDEKDLGRIKEDWLEARDNAVYSAVQLNNGFNIKDEGGKYVMTKPELRVNRVTKQLVNRLLEPFMWTTMLITGSKEGWDNFFKLRCPSYEWFDYDDYENQYPKYFKSKKEWLGQQDTYDTYVPTELQWLQRNKGQAEIHIMDLAEKIYDAMNESTPEHLKSGQWHVPFIDKIVHNNFTLSNEELVKISTAMAARTSYTVVGEEKEIDYSKMIELHDRLLSQDPPHSSPLEHCARAMSDGEYFLFNKGKGVAIHELGVSYSNPVVNFHKKDKGWCNNLKGFIPYRYFIDNKIEL